MLEQRTRVQNHSKRFHACLRTDVPCHMSFSRAPADWSPQYLSDDALHALSYIFNLSLLQGKFPDAFKKTKIVPIFKKGDSKIYLTIGLLAYFHRFQNF